MRWGDGTPALGGKVRQRDMRSIVLSYGGVFHGTGEAAFVWSVSRTQALQWALDSG